MRFFFLYLLNKSWQETSIKCFKLSVDQEVLWFLSDSTFQVSHDAQYLLSFNSMFSTTPFFADSTLLSLGFCRVAEQWSDEDEVEWLDTTSVEAGLQLICFQRKTQLLTSQVTILFFFFQPS